MYQIQATVARNSNRSGQTFSELQQQEFALAQEATPCLLIRTSYQNRIPGHLRDFQKTVKEGPSIQRISQDPQTRTSYQHPRRTFIQAPAQGIFKISMQGPLEDDFSRISTRSSHKDLYEIMQGHLEDVTRTYSIASDKVLKIMQRPLTAFHQDLHKIFPKGRVQDHSRFLGGFHISTRSFHTEV